MQIMQKPKLKTTLKRFLSGALAAVMCMGFLPATPVLAADADITDRAALIVETVDNVQHKPLAGVTVRIECTSAGQYHDYGEATSNSSGDIAIGEVPVGYYRITPLSAPEGYRIDPSPVLVYLPDDQGDSPVSTITVYALNPLVIRKVEPGTGAGLPNATFQVANSQNEVVATVTTDADGYAMVPNMMPGDYTITETSRPSGQYIATAQKCHISENPEGDTVVVFYGEVKDMIIVRKTDKGTGEPLSGAEFSLKKGDSEVAKAVTDTEGFAYFKEVEAGNYTLTETKFPDGYIQEVTSRPVEVRVDSGNIVIPVTNSKPGNLQVYSKDDKNQMVPNTMIQVLNDRGQVVGGPTATSNGGLATFQGLEPGNYTVTAVAADGYVLVQTTKDVVIEKDKTSVIEFVSQAEPSLLITCVDNNGKAVNGATFNVQKTNLEPIGSYETGSDGTALISELEPGGYTITMTDVPDPYVVSATVQTRVLRAGTQTTVKFTVYEKPYLEIIHYIKGTTTPLAGAKFEVVKGSETIGSYVAGTDGRVLIENLDPGEYTVKHVSTPDGYTIDEASQKVQLTAGKSGYLEFTSSKKNSIIISKVDKVSNAPLAGAEFQIRTLDGQVLDTVTTGKDGLASSIVLDPGQYIVSEIHAPDGYVMDENSRIVTVNLNESSLQKFTNEKKSSIVITALDYFGNPVPNAVFSVSDSKSGVIVDTVTTDENGVVVTKVLDPGAYIVREVSAPAGYIKETGTMYDVPVTGDGSTAVTFLHSMETVIQIVNQNKNGDPISGSQFKVVNQDTGYVVGYFTTDESGIVNTPTLASGTYIVSQIVAGSGYTTKNETYTVTVEANKAAIVRFENAKMSVINIKKTDRQTGAPLAGAVFTISDSSGHVVGRYTTDSTGCLTTQPLPADTYLIREYYAPEGYAIDDSCRTNVVLKEDENTTVEMTNRKAPVIQIVKEDAETGELLAGAEFTILNDRGEEVGTYMTDINGIATSEELAPGKYTVSETKAPEGYALNPTPFTATVSAGESYRLTVQDSRLSGLVISKVDGEGNPLADAEFTIYAKNGSIVSTVKTDVSGTASCDGLESGTYFIRETKAPAGYKLDSSAKMIQIKENTGASLKVVNESLASIVIKKEDAQTRMPLADAHFIVTNAAGEEVASLVTDSSGMARTGKLPDGTYQVRETKAPDGYIVDQSVRTVQISSGNTQTLTITNSTTSVVYIHLNELTTNVELSGGTFVVRTEAGVVVGQGRTENGLLVISGLEPGDYIVSQIAAPDGYIKDSYTQNITVSRTENTHVYFLNKALTGLVIESVIVGTHEPLAGCKYEVYNKEGKVVYEGTSADDGFLIVGTLNPGKYTIKQVATADGYSIVTSTQTVMVTNTEPTQVIFKNQPLPSLVIELVDKLSGEYLAGAEFKIQSVDGKFVTEVVTDQGGMVTVPNLKPGYYLVTQMTAPNGDYILNGTYQFAYMSFGNNTKLTFTNEKFTGLVIENVIVDTHEPLAGGKFEVWTLNESTKVFEGTTDRTGTLQTDKLDPGKYLIKHLATADGYTIVTGTQIVEVKKYEASHAVFENKPIGTLEITKVDAVTRDPLEGASFKVVKENSSFETTVSTGADGVARVANLEPGVYVVTEVLAPEGYRLNNLAQNATIRYGETTRLTFANDRLTGIVIEKTDSVTGAPLDGAVFEIAHENGNIVGTYTTDAAGHIQTEPLTPGRYTIKEKVAPTGYILDDAVKTVTVKENEPTIVPFTNKAMTGIVIEKTDNKTGAPLEGAKFEIRNSTNAVVETIITDASGRAETQTLTPGRYTVKELNAPDGYILDETVKVIEVKTGSPAIVPVTNRKMSGIMIYKTDLNTGAALAGAQFEVSEVGGKVIGTYTTDEAGIIEIPNLTPGNYTIKEIQAPDGYILDSSAKTAVVTDNEATIVRFTNQALAGLVIEKVDSKSKEPLSGAEFEIWNKNQTQRLGTYETDSSGVVMVPGLQPGTYIVKETRAPYGYAIDVASKTVEVKANVSTTVRFEDTQKPSLMIEKVDSINPNKRLSGATFSLYTQSGAYVGDYTTNEAGVVIIDNLDAGQYKVVETKAPAGYQIDTGTQTINVKAAMQTKITVTNTPITGIVITKVDAETNKPLAGAQFQISKLNGSIVNTYTTDISGVINTEPLDPGQYVIKELRAPDGYVIDEASKIVTVTAGEATNIQITNTRMAGIELKKIDATTNEPLEGAVFELCDSTGKKLGELRTDSTGLAYSEVLTPGEYIIKETQAPDGYVIDSSAKTVKVEANTMTKVTMTNSKMTALQIWKMDAVTGNMLAGATFEIQTADGKFVTTVTTGTDGIAVVPELTPGTYLVTEKTAPEGYDLDTTPQTVKVGTDTPSVLKFYNNPLAALRIQKVDGETGETLSGARFKITKANGDYVGEFVTELDGMINLPTMDPGQYVITEISAPEGYIKDETPRTVEVKTGTPTVVTIENNRVAGLQIRKTVTQNGESLQGVTFKIKTAEGELVGNYTTDSMGLIYVSLEPGEYIVQETFTPDGYVLDDTPKFVTIKENTPVVLEITNDKLSNVRIHKIDAETGEGIYGVTFEIKDSKSNYIGTYTTDDQGYIDLSAVLVDGKYVITEKKAADGYVLDTIPRTVTVNHSEPTVITWENSREKGQLQITKYSAEDNATLNIPKNTALAGAQFTITTLNGEVVDVIETNASGVAYSGALDLGTYLVQETKAPQGYAINSKVVQVNVTSKNQKIDLAFYDNNLDVAVNIEKRGETQVRPGNSMKYYLMNIKNNSDVAVDNFYVTDKLPTDAVRAQTLYTGTWSSTVYYSIQYKTNMYDYRTLATNLNSTTQYDFDLSSTALNLESGEYVTEIRFEMGTVPAAFHEVVSPVLYAYVLPSVPNNYQIINRCEVGAQYNGGWVTDADSWTTLVVKPTIQLPDKLPTTGF